MAEYQIEFQDPQFRVGFNTTCRLGDKWFSRLKVGDKVDIVSSGCVVAEVEVVCLEYLQFSSMTDICVASNHVARDFDELAVAMESAYPVDFDADEHVTLIGFDMPFAVSSELGLWWRTKKEPPKEEPVLFEFS